MKTRRISPCLIRLQTPTVNVGVAVHRINGVDFIGRKRNGQIAVNNRRYQSGEAHGGVMTG